MVGAAPAVALFRPVPEIVWLRERALFSPRALSGFLFVFAVCAAAGLLQFGRVGPFELFESEASDGASRT